MAKYMINICCGDLEKRKQAKQYDGSFVMQKYIEWTQKLGEKRIFAHKLRDGEGRKLDLVNGTIQDGPYTETKESIGGFYIVEAASYDEAVTLAKDCPTLLYQGGYVEVREVEV